MKKILLILLILLIVQFSLFAYTYVSTAAGFGGNIGSNSFVLSDVVNLIFGFDISDYVGIGPAFHIDSGLEWASGPNSPYVVVSIAPGIGMGITPTDSIGINLLAGPSFTLLGTNLSIGIFLDAGFSYKFPDSNFSALIGAAGYYTITASANTFSITVPANTFSIVGYLGFSYTLKSRKSNQPQIAPASKSYLVY